LYSPDELLQPLPGGWSGKDTLAHVANSERLNVNFARLMLTADKPIQLEAVAGDYPDYVAQYPTFQLDTFNAYMTGKLRRLSLAEVLKELAQVRAATLEWIETLTPAQLERRGLHAVWGEQSVRGMLKILNLHDKMHTQDLARRASPAE
jgi:hypothetical protein